VTLASTLLSWTQSSKCSKKCTSDHTSIVAPKLCCKCTCYCRHYVVLLCTPDQTNAHPIKRPHLSTSSA
jgi:hypothetical protein